MVSFVITCGGAILQKTEELENERLIVGIIAPLGIERNDALILKFTYKSPRTMPTMCTVLGIPVVECHRRVRKLMSLGLIKRFTVSHPVTSSDSKRKVFYAVNSEKVEIMSDDGKIRIKLKKVGVPDGSVFQYA
jgi:hypothetical protein